jgi:hypothetical protein
MNIYIYMHEYILVYTRMIVLCQNAPHYIGKSGFVVPSVYLSICMYVGLCMHVRFLAPEEFEDFIHIRYLIIYPP